MSTSDLPPFGTGSIVTPEPDHWQYGEWAGRLLLVLLSDRGGSWSTGLYRHGGNPARLAHVPLDLSGWSLVRAVPPLDDPCPACGGSKFRGQMEDGYCETCRGSGTRLPRPRFIATDDEPSITFQSDGGSPHGLAITDEPKHGITCKCRGSRMVLVGDGMLGQCDGLEEQDRDD